MKEQNKQIPLQNALELIHVAEMRHPSGSRIYAHARKTFGLIQVMSGSAIYEFDGVLYPVKAGDLFCIPQKLPFFMRPIEKTLYSTRQFGLLIQDPELYHRMKTLHPPLTVDPTLKSMLDYLFKFWNIPTNENRLLLNSFLQTIFLKNTATILRRSFTIRKLK